MSTVKTMEQRVVAVSALAGKPRPPGVYFGLAEDQYHADPSLGSSSVRDLWFSPTDYWWGSLHNPNRPDESDDTASKIRGRAMHKLVLEGENAFDLEYMRGAVHTSDMSPSDKGQATKAANAAASKVGKVALPGADYDRIVIAAAMIYKNPHLAGAFTKGLGEVSVFWLDNGVPCKARLDWLKASTPATRLDGQQLPGAGWGGVGDLKSISTWKKGEFKRACRDAITAYRYDMQGAHYLRGAHQIRKLVADGCVYGKHDPDLLKAVAAEKRFAFQFIFFQATRSPITHSVVITPADANPLYVAARRDVDEALQVYRDNVAKFTLDTPWLLLEPPAELHIEDMPSWFGRK